MVVVGEWGWWTEVDGSGGVVVVVVVMVMVVMVAAIEIEVVVAAIAGCRLWRGWGDMVGAIAVRWRW